MFQPSLPDIFDGSAPLDSNSSQTTAPSFFLTTMVVRGTLRPLETFLTVADVLGSDPYYSGSYSNVRQARGGGAPAHVAAENTAW